MKKLSFVLVAIALISVTSGCALKEYYAACKADEACVARAEGVKKNTETLVSTGVALVPHPAAQVAAKPAGKVSGSVAGVIAMILFGRALTKKKKENELPTEA
jgi:hypothetical protein